jgi:hypothetical protein
MAWRPYENLIEGILDNTQPGKVTGWITFFRLGKEPLRVTLDLDGDCHRDLQGRKFRIFNPEPSERLDRQSYVDGLDQVQKGQAGDITAGDPPADYVGYPYIEWYSDANGRVVLELDRSQLEILTPEPTGSAKKLDRGQQHQNMNRYLTDLVRDTGAVFGAVVGEADSKDEESKGA